MRTWTLSPEIELHYEGELGTAVVKQSGVTIPLSAPQCRILRSNTLPEDGDDVVAATAAAWSLLRVGILISDSEDDRLPGDFVAPHDPIFGAAWPEGVPPGDDSPTAVVIGLPWDFGNVLTGAALGPDVLRRASAAVSADRLTAGWYSYRLERDFEPVPILDLGDLNCRLLTSYQEIGTALRSTFSRMRRSALPIFLGGEHGLTREILTALPVRPASLVVLDAHDDFEEGDAVNHGSWLRHAVTERLVDDVLLIGVRGIAPRGRGAALSRAGVRVHTAGAWMHDPSKIEAALDVLPPGPVYLSIDIDVLDPAFAPGTLCLRSGGVRPHQIEDLIIAIAARRAICGIDFMELCTPRSAYDMTPLIASEMLFFACHAALSK